MVSHDIAIIAQKYYSCDELQTRQFYFEIIVNLWENQTNRPYWWPSKSFHSFKVTRKFVIIKKKSNNSRGICMPSTCMISSNWKFTLKYWLQYNTDSPSLIEVSSHKTNMAVEMKMANQLLAMLLLSQMLSLAMLVYCNIHCWFYGISP